MTLHRVDRIVRRGLASIPFLLLLFVFTLPGQEAVLGQELSSKEILKAEHYVTPTGDRRGRTRAQVPERFAHEYQQE